MRSFLLCALLLSHLPVASSRSDVAKVGGFTECAITDDLKVADRCDNVLMVDFDRQRKNSAFVKTVRDRVLSVKLLPGPAGEDTQDRKAKRRCNILNSASKILNVRYQAPEALLHLPLSGTGDRVIVTAKFEVKRDGDCLEATYGVKQKSDEWIRVLQFVSANTIANAVRDIKKDTKIGEWHSWAISVKTPVIGDSTFRLEHLKKGKYLLCAIVHDSIYHQNAAFLGCEAQRRLYSATKSRLFGASVSLDSAITLFKNHDTKARAAVGGAVSTLAAWGRCGNLGCCALN